MGRFFVHFFPRKSTFRGKLHGIFLKMIFQNFFRGKFHFFPTFFGGKFSAEFSPKFSLEKMYEKSVTLPNDLFRPAGRDQPVL
jgi:hypothetical protein